MTDPKVSPVSALVQRLLSGAKIVRIFGASEAESRPDYRLMLSPEEVDLLAAALRGGGSSPTGETLSVRGEDFWIDELQYQLGDRPPLTPTGRDCLRSWLRAFAANQNRIAQSMARLAALSAPSKGSIKRFAGFPLTDSATVKAAPSSQATPTWGRKELPMTEKCGKYFQCDPAVVTRCGFEPNHEGSCGAMSQQILSDLRDVAAGRKIAIPISGGTSPTPPPALADLVTCSLAYPDYVCHPRRLDCEHEAPHLMAACGAFTAAPVEAAASSPATGASIAALPAQWREEAMTRRVMPPGGKPTVAQLNAAYLDVAEARRACADQLEAALSAPSSHTAKE